MMDDNWDTIVDLERQEYDKGYAAGFQESLHSKDDSGGYSQGLLKGYAVGFEAGFIAAAATCMMEDATGDSKEVALTERGKKKVEEMKSKALTIPNINGGEIDFDDAVQSIRSKYKQLGSTYGACPPKLVDQQTVATHEW